MNASIDRPVTIFLSAAEASGDEHAANLMEALRRRIPNARFIGVAGEQMAAAGCEVLADLTGKAAMLGGPLLRLGYYIRTIRRLRKAIGEIRPDVHVPVNSPAMNWHLARAAKQAGAPVVYYIAPQVWAWAPWRVRKLARLTDAVACILPFEQSYLRRRGVNATYVGHPVFDDRPPQPDPPLDLLDAWYHGTWRVALLPGSRPAEIRHHTGPLVAVAKAIRRRWHGARCTFATLRAYDPDAVGRMVRRIGTSDIEFVAGKESAQRVLAGSHFAVAGSGTVTLQAAYFGVPMVVFYRTGPLTSFLYRTLGRLRSLVATPHFSLVNILAGRRIVPEFVPWRHSTAKLVRMTLEVMNDPGFLCDARKNLLELVRPLCVAPPGKAADNAADLVVRVLQQRRLTASP
ncbi:MAG TPA: lipid-A-disaccharide synthase [Phycisphaerae bacterium]|nr:lipid-A-disaccharide synthase [Phycisphaerae bacterium]